MIVGAPVRGSVFSSACLSREILGQLTEKWCFLILHLLATGPMRTAELHRQIGGISEKMLIQTLRRLQRNGFVTRTTYGEVPPRVEYALTPFGGALVPIVTAFDRFVEDNMRTILEARARFDAQTA